MITVGLFPLSFPSSVKTPRDRHGILLYENTIAAVEDFPTFHVDKVIVYQSPEQPEAVHSMKIHLAKQSCDNLPSYVTHNNSQSYSLPQNNTFYLLKGSKLNYNICAVTNESGAYMDFYIVGGLHEIKKGKKPNNYICHSAIYFGHRDIPPNGTKPDHHWRCRHIQYTTDKNGYYSTLLFPSKLSPEDVWFWHETNNSYRVINVHDIPAAFCTEESDTHEKDKACDITIESEMHAFIGQHQCVVVHVSTAVEQQDTSKFTEVDVQFSYRDTGRNLFYIFGCVILPVPSFILLVLAFIGMRKYCGECR